jgi:hypothetical protein
MINKIINKMKKHIKNALLLLIFAVSLTGCENYLDVNVPSGAIVEEDLEMKDLLGPLLFTTAYAQYYTETTTSNYVQYYAGYGYAAAGESSTSTTWNRIYTRILPNVRTLREKATNANATHYDAIGKIIEAVNMGLAVDLWNNVPYSQAGKVFEFPKPEFDSGEVVYGNAISLLDEAISALSAADNSGIPITGDIIYNGNIDQWLRAAYTFKARLQLHMIKNSDVTADDVYATISNGFTSNQDNFMLDYPSGEINPHYSTNILARNTSNYYRAPNDQLISALNGKTYPFQGTAVTIDPRLPAIFENEGEVNDPWRGFMNGGTEESSDGEPGNTFYKNGGYYTSANSPIIVITYAEAMFIKAEAAFLMNGGNTTSTGSTTIAYDSYKSGIEANMSMIGVNGADYMADPVVNVGTAGLMLNHIMKEKYIANIHNAETYNDFRRYNFSSDVFKGLALRLEEDDTGVYSGEWFRRMIYPFTEEDGNLDIVLANRQLPTVPVWWAE